MPGTLYRLFEVLRKLQMPLGLPHDPRAEQPSQEFTFLGAVKIVRQSECDGCPGMTRITFHVWAENHALMQDTGLIRQFGPRAGHTKEEGC